MIDFIKRILSRYGFGRREPRGMPFEDRGRMDWYNAEWFYSRSDRLICVTEDGIISMEPAAVKARRLAAIARERDALKERLAKAIRQKKSRQPIYKALRALSVEELRLESGK